MLRNVLKSKLHRATVTDSNIEYEGSISIATDLMRAADLWVNERVLVTSVTNGQRLETYVIEGKEGSGEIVINGAAAHLIGTGQMVTIMAFGLVGLSVGVVTGLGGVWWITHRREAVAATVQDHRRRKRDWLIAQHNAGSTQADNASPALASIVSSIGVPASTQENLWAPMDIAKPEVTPIDVSAFAVQSADTPVPTAVPTQRATSTSEPTSEPTEAPTEAAATATTEVAASPEAENQTATRPEGLDAWWDTIDDGLAALPRHLGDRVRELVGGLHLQMLGHHLADHRHADGIVVADVDLPQVGAFLQLLRRPQVVDHRGGGLGAHLLERRPQPLAVRGGGHNVAGNAVCDGGIVIDLTLMNGVRVDLAARTVRAGGGATLGDVDRETHAFGRAVPVGVVSQDVVRLSSLSWKRSNRVSPAGQVLASATTAKRAP